MEFDLDALDDYDWDWETKYGAGVREELARVYATSAGLVAPGLKPAELQRLSSKWAAKRAGALLKLDGSMSMAATTRDRVKELVSRTIANGESLSQLSKTLREDIIFSPARADMVAQTETATALGQGGREAADAAGKEEKAWYTQGGVTDVCADNEAEGWIPIDDSFPSGDDTVPAHVNCECDVLYRGGGE